MSAGERPEWVRVVGTPAMERVVDEIATERVRQQQVEGWTPEHDDEHDDGQLASAAAGYAMRASGRQDLRYGDDGKTFVPRGWPWSAAWWKPKNPRRDLIRAAALIVAEIERIDRADAPSPATEGGR